MVPNSIIPKKAIQVRITLFYGVFILIIDSYGAYSNSDHMKRTFGLGDYDNIKHKKAAFNFKKFHKKDENPSKQK